VRTSIRVGVDVGGTFTDLVTYDASTGHLQVAKVPSDPSDQSRGMMHGLDVMCIEMPSIDLVVHGTTVATNAVLERTGAACGLITTTGFRDVLDLRRRDRPDTYGLKGYFAPLVSRNCRVEVHERMDAAGNVLLDPCDQDVVAAARELQKRGVEVIIVSFLNSYVNPANEQKAKRILDDVWTNQYIVVASEILPEIREFERTSTAVINGYVMVLLDRYLQSTMNRLTDRGYNRDVLLMQGNGGLMSQGTARRYPVNTVLSGPAAGVIAAQHIGTLVGEQNLITCDVGGTSLDIAVVEQGQSGTTRETSLEYGLPMRTTMLDIRSIAAGGGSIAWIDGGGILQIGPHSAGADPGPACYGKGGQDPTVTDANLVLGRIGLSNPIGRGESWSFDKERAERVINDTIASRLDISVIDAAWAILEVANQRIANSIRMLTVERGYDPRDFVLVAYGGAGPLHACSILNEIQTAKALIPPWPGVTSALGCIIADVRHDFIQMVDRRLDDIRISELYDVFEDHAEQGKRRIAHERAQVDSIDFVYQADVSYDGQMYEVLVHLPVEQCTHEDIRRAFEQAYAMTYGHIINNRPIRVMMLRTAVIGVRPGVDLFGPTVTRSRTAKDALKEHRPVYFEQGFEECPVYDRDRLPPKSSLLGPAIVEHGDATTVIEPNMVAEVDVRGNLIVRHGH